MATLDFYLQRFRHLRRDTTHAWMAATRGGAPHKPMLLLALLDSIEEGTVTRNLVEITPELAELFGLYWSKMMSPEQRGSMAKPFFHLRSEGFWHLIAQPGYEDTLPSLNSVDSLARLRTLLVGARLDEALWSLVCASKARDALRATLIESYFAPEVGSVLWQQSRINVAANTYAQELISRALHSQTLSSQVSHDDKGDQTSDPATSSKIRVEDKIAVRNQGFRRAVVTAYAHRCALCGLRITTPEAHTVVEAAHIQPWSISHKDDPRNGLALCRLCHWSFDEGLVGVSPHYVVTVSRLLSDNENLPGHLVTLRDREIFKPAQSALWPDTKLLHWHEEWVFRKH